MVFTDYDSIKFYSDVQSDTVIYAEFIIPSDGESMPDRKKFVKIDNALFASYLREIVIPDLTEKTSAGEIIRKVKDRISLWGNQDRVSPKVRTAGKLADGCIEYDLMNDDVQYVRVTAERWGVTKKAKQKFLRGNLSLTQSMPKPPTKPLLDLLHPYVNCDGDSLILFVVWLVQSFCEGNHSILLVMAGKGCGKSTLSKIIRQIIDPSKLEVATMPKKLDDLTVTLTNTYVAAFDNTDELTKEQSNLLCSSVTGATTVKRELYSTNDLCVLTLHNTLIINGIDIMPSESDLADRCLLLNLLPIDSSHRKTDSDIHGRFMADLPEILGGIFDALSKAMTTIHSISPRNLPRMAESYKEMLAIALALGITETHFQTIYNANLNAIDKARSDIAIVQAVKEYMTSQFVPGRKLSGTATELYKKICANYSGHKQDLPKSASHFSRKLNAEHAALYAAGYTVNIDRTHADGTHIEIIKK